MFKDKELESEFEKFAKIRVVKAGTVLMEAGKYIKFIPIVIKGCIRVLRQNNNKEEVFLYHIIPGETCAMSLSCCSSMRPSEVKTIAEDDTEFWEIPVQKLEDWQQYKEWRDFIALSYQTRFNKMLQAIDDIAFSNMDKRLWKYLLERSYALDNNILNISHDEIANELGIERETVTRLIKKLKDLGYLKTGRNEIQILKKDELM